MSLKPMTLMEGIGLPPKQPISVISDSKIFFFILGITMSRFVFEILGVGQLVGRGRGRKDEFFLARVSVSFYRNLHVCIQR